MAPATNNWPSVSLAEKTTRYGQIFYAEKADPSMAMSLCRCRRRSRPTGPCGCQGADRSAWGRDKFVWPAVNGLRRIDRAMRDANESSPQSREELSKSSLPSRGSCLLHCKLRRYSQTQQCFDFFLYDDDPAPLVNQPTFLCKLLQIDSHSRP
jgi:hypothetical protein